MKFFIPLADSDEQAERVYGSVVEFNNAKSTPRRIFGIGWDHNGTHYHAEVGKQIDAYFGGELVLAIVESDNLYFVCTENRGVVRGQGIFVGKGLSNINGPTLTYFD